MVKPRDAIWLYGSHSRGDYDAASDIDVLFVTDSEDSELSSYQLPQFPKDPAVSKYTWVEIERMAEYGSLFLKHLSLEAHPIHEGRYVRGRLNSLLGSLTSYKRASTDLRAFKIVHSDVNESLKDHTSSLIFEVATLATVFRHACILGCDLSGSPCFSRIEPTQKIVDIWGLPKVWSDEFPRFYSYRLYADGRELDVMNLDIEYVRIWHRRVGVFLTEMQGRIYE